VLAQLAMEDGPSSLPASVAETVVSKLTDLDDDCLRVLELHLPLAAASAFRALCKHTAGLVSPVGTELEWARGVSKSGFNRQAVARLAELKGMPRAAAHFGRAPLTMDTLEVAARLLTGEPVAGSAQLQPDNFRGRRGVPARRACPLRLRMGPAAPGPAQQRWRTHDCTSVQSTA
jgi:hypothetical protein